MDLPVLTPRLRLREFTPEDLPALLALYADPRVTAQLPFWPEGLEATRRHLRRVVAAQRAVPRRLFELAVEVRRTGAFAGACSLLITTPESAVRRGALRTVEVGYVLARPRWGHGYAGELVKALLRAAWEPLELQQAVAIVAQGNDRSVSVLRGAGFGWEARLPRFTRTRGRWWDCEQYAASAPPGRPSRSGGRRG